jgi:hypothetical protein
MSPLELGIETDCFKAKKENRHRFSTLCYAIPILFGTNLALRRFP